MELMRVDDVILSCHVLLRSSICPRHLQSRSYSIAAVAPDRPSGPLTYGEPHGIRLVRPSTWGSWGGSWGASWIGSSMLACRYFGMDLACRLVHAPCARSAEAGNERKL